MILRNHKPGPCCSRTEGHTADIWIVGEGRDCPSVLASMVESLYLLVSDEYSLEGEAPWRFEVRGASPEEALVRFLSEVLYLLEGEGLLLIDLDIEAVPEKDGLTIRTRCKASRFDIHDRTGIEVKAITYHDARLDILPGRCSARVLVDI